MRVININSQEYKNDQIRFLKLKRKISEIPEVPKKRKYEFFSNYCSLCPNTITNPDHGKDDS